MASKIVKKYSSILFNKDLIITLLTRFVTLILAFIISVYTARVLGPEGRGEYFFIISFTMIVSQFGYLGLQTSNTYYVADNQSLLGRLTINSLWVSIIAGAAGAITGVIIWSYISHINITSSSHMLVTILIAPAMIFYLLAGNLFIGINRIFLFNIYQLLNYFFILISLITISLIHISVENFLLATVTGWFLVGFFMLLNLLKIAGTTSFKFDMNLFRMGFKYAIKIYILSLLSVLILRSGTMLLRYMTDAQTLGYYSIASQLFDTLSILPITMGMLLFPKLVKEKHSQWRQSKSNLTMIAIMMILASIISVILVKPFIVIAFGVEYLPAVKIFYFILPGIIFYGFISIISQYLTANGVPLGQIVSWLIGFIILIVLNIILIPKYGALGTAAALSITFMLVFLAFYLLALTEERKKSASQLQTTLLNSESGG